MAAGQTVIQPVFRYNTRQNIVPVGSLNFSSFGSGAQRLQLPRSGWLSRLYMQLAGTITTGAGSPSGAFATYQPTPWSLLSLIRLYTNTQTDIINWSGWGSHVDESTRSETGPTDQTVFTNYNTNNQAQFVAAPSGNVAASTAYNVRGNFELPVFSDDALNLGLIFLQSDQITMTLELTPAAQADVIGTIAGVTITPNYTVNVYAEYFDDPPRYGNMPPIQPNTEFAVLRREENRSIISTGETFYRLPVGNTYTRILGILENNAGPIAPANINSVGIRYGQTVTPYNEDYRIHLLRNFKYLGYVLPDGCFLFDFTRGSGVEGVWDGRDFINSSRTSDIGVVVNLPTALSLTNPRLRLITTQLAAIGGPSA